MAMLHYVDDRPIVLTENGAWEQGGEPLHPKVALLFSAQVVPTGPTEFEIQIGHQRQRVEVRDAAFFVRSLLLQRDDDGTLVELKGRLSDGREEVLDPATFEQREDGVFYVRLVRNGFKTRCRLSSSQYHELALECEPAEIDGYQIDIGGKGWRIDEPMGPPNIPIM